MAKTPNTAGANNATLAAPNTTPSHMFPITPPATPETSGKVTGDIIRNSPHGTITGSCHRHQCLGYIVKMITNEHDPNGWHLECTRKGDRLRPCNFRRDVDGTVTKPLARPPPVTPTRRRPVRPSAGWPVHPGPTPSTLAEKSGVVSKQTPEPGLKAVKCTFKEGKADRCVTTDSRFLAVHFKGPKDLGYRCSHAWRWGPGPEPSGTRQFHPERPRSSLQAIRVDPKTPLCKDRKACRRRRPRGLQRSCDQARVRRCARKHAWQPAQGRIRRRDRHGLAGCRHPPRQCRGSKREIEERCRDAQGQDRRTVGDGFSCHRSQARYRSQDPDQEPSTPTSTHIYANHRHPSIPEQNGGGGGAVGRFCRLWKSRREAASDSEPACHAASPPEAAAAAAAEDLHRQAAGGLDSSGYTRG